MKHKVFLFGSIIATVGVCTPLLTACSSVGKANVSELTALHEWINDRTFSLGQTYDFEEDGRTYFSIMFGTCWLFYHIDNASDDYQYFALTNFHVAGNMTNIIYSPKSDQSYHYGDILYAYQTNDQIKGDSTRINYSNIATGNANPSQLNELTTYSNGKVSGESTKSAKFLAEYTEYITIPFDLTYQPYVHPSSGTIRSFFDLDVVFLDFKDEYTKSKSKGDSALANRLDSLNTYADTHSNYVTPFQTTSGYSTMYSKMQNQQDVSVYTGGYPLATLNEDEIYTDTSYKYQYQIFQGLQWYFPRQDYWPAFTIVDPLDDYESSNWIYYSLADHTTAFDNVGIIEGQDYVSAQNDLSIAMGGGASGSMGIYTDDISDPNTYLATGIYWGGYYFGDESQTYGMYCSYTPFLINQGSKITLTDTQQQTAAYYPGGDAYFAATSKTFIEYFMEAYQNSQLPLDDNMTAKV